MFKVHRTRNIALIQQTLAIPNFVPDVERSMWLALSKDDTLRGFAVLSVDSDHGARLAFEFPEEPNVMEAKALVSAAWVVLPSTIVKLTALVPVAAAARVRLYQRAGFLREGVNRKSVVGTDGRLEDQYYLGLTRPQE